MLSGSLLTPVRHQCARCDRLTRAIRILAVVIVFALGVMFGMAEASGATRRVPCRDKVTVTAKIRCLSLHFDTPGGPTKAIAVAVCESSLNPRSYDGIHAGLFQHRIRYWPARWEKYARPYGLPNDPFDALTNTLVTMRMVTDRDIGWRPWSCA